MALREGLKFFEFSAFVIGTHHLDGWEPTVPEGAPPSANEGCNEAVTAYDLP